MKGALNAPDRKRPHPPRNRRNRREGSKAGVREILLRHEGLVPVRLSIGSKPVRALSSGLILAGHRIDRPVFSAGPRSPGSRPGDAPWTPGSLFALIKVRGRQVGRKRRPSVRQRRNPRSTWRQPFTCSRDRRNRKEDRRSDKQPKANKQRLRRAAFRAGSGSKKRKRPCLKVRVTL
jgi:hypothetical protein